MPVAAVAGSAQMITPQDMVPVMDVMPEPCLELESMPSPALDRPCKFAAGTRTDNLEFIKLHVARHSCAAVAQFPQHHLAAFHTRLFR